MTKMMSDKMINAIKNGDNEAVKLLLNNGEDVNAKDKDGDTALIYAASEDHADIAKELIIAGANPDIKDNEVWNKTTNKPFMKAILEKSIKDKYGIDFSYQTQTLSEAKDTQFWVNTAKEMIFMAIKHGISTP